MPGLTSSARMLAALSATNEAILRTRSPEEVYQHVCDAAVHGGQFRSAAALLAESDDSLRFMAGAGPNDLRTLRGLKISVDANSVHGRGLTGMDASLAHELARRAKAPISGWRAGRQLFSERLSPAPAANRVC